MVQIKILMHRLRPRSHHLVTSMLAVTSASALATGDLRETTCRNKRMKGVEMSKNITSAAEFIKAVTVIVGAKKGARVG